MEKKIKLVCPECNKEFNTDIYTSINVQLDKDMKTKILSGKLFDIECEHCHSKFHIHILFYITIWKRNFNSVYRRKRLKIE